MDTLIFSQPAIFRLQQLASHLHRKTGVRHKLSTPEGIVGLLNDSRRSPTDDIQECYAAFFTELNEEQIRALVERGFNFMPDIPSRSALARHAS